MYHKLEKSALELERKKTTWSDSMLVAVNGIQCYILSPVNIANKKIINITNEWLFN